MDVVVVAVTVETEVTVEVTVESCVTVVVEPCARVTVETCVRVVVLLEVMVVTCVRLLNEPETTIETAAAETMRATARAATVFVIPDLILFDILSTDLSRAFDFLQE